MPKKNKPLPVEERRPKRRVANDGGKHAGAERPPESAEDFGHVLRRLIAGRAAERAERGS